MAERTNHIEELRACPNPWCEHSDPVVELTLRYMGDNSPRRVECECGMRGPAKPSEAEAIAAWNKRPTPTDSAYQHQAAQERVSEALQDSAYLAGVTAGWNAAQADDPNAALASIQAAYSGHLAGFKEAQAVLLSVQQSAKTSEGER